MVWLGQDRDMDGLDRTGTGTGQEGLSAFVSHVVFHVPACRLSLPTLPLPTHPQKAFPHPPHHHPHPPSFCLYRMVKINGWQQQLARGSSWTVCVWRCLAFPHLHPHSPFFPFPIPFPDMHTCFMQGLSCMFLRFEVWDRLTASEH